MSDSDEFAQFVTDSGRGLQRAAWLLTGDWPTAEDLVQTALTKTWQRWQGGGPIEHPEAYVRRVMVTTFIRWRRRSWRRELLVNAPETAVPDRDLGRVDSGRAIQTALDVLAPKQRAIVVLRYFVDLSEAETASVMGCAVGTVKSQSAKALSRLRHVPGLSDVMTERRTL